MDIIITRKPRGEYFFEAKTPKGEEWLQLHLKVDAMRLTRMEKWVFKQAMHKAGVEVDDQSQ